MAVKTKEGRGRRGGAAAVKEEGTAPGTDLTDHGEETWTGSTGGEGEADAGGGEGWTMAAPPVAAEGRTAALEAEVTGLRAENEALRARLAAWEGATTEEDAEPAQDPLLGTLTPAWAAWNARREGGAQ